MDKELHGRISKLSDDELWDLVNVNPADYRREAIDFATEELHRRGCSQSNAEPEDILLPLSIDDVPYLHTSYSGDLILTRGILYYFPHTDLDKGKRVKFAHVAGLVGAVIDGLASQFRTANRSKLRKEGLWNDEDSSETLQKKLDAYIEDTKQKHNLYSYASSLPLLMRFARDEVKNLTLSFEGQLSFETQFDKHDFFIGTAKRRLLDDALKEAGFSIAHAA